MAFPFPVWRVTRIIPIAASQLVFPSILQLLLMSIFDKLNIPFQVQNV